MRKSILWTIFVPALLLASSCKSTKIGDIAVFGSIYTASDEMPVAEAMVIKNGKYIYVGDKEGAMGFIKEGRTQVYDRTGAGMVMPGATDGHCHRLTGNLIPLLGSIHLTNEDYAPDILAKVKEKCTELKAQGKTSLFAFGFSQFNLMDKGFPTLAQLDEAGQGIAVLLYDDSGHAALANSVCMRNAGLIDEDGKLLFSEVRGGEIETDGNGCPTGFITERAISIFLRYGGVDVAELIDRSIVRKTIELSQHQLHSNGYTNAFDAWTNNFHPLYWYEELAGMDKEGRLKVNYTVCYEIEPWLSDIDKEIEYNAELVDKYTTPHLHPNVLKMFMDGCVETNTGYILEDYPESDITGPIWTKDEVAGIVAKANAKGLTVHMHTMGDAAVRLTTDAFIEGGREGFRNAMVHMRNVRPEDYARIAEHNIACVAGLHWHMSPSREQCPDLPEYYLTHAYPIRSFFDNGIKVSSHTDFPANTGAPLDIFGIMEIAVTGMNSPDDKVVEPQELVSREQAFKALTINGAWQLYLENERGSIEVGKYADFLFADKDVFKCPANEIHTAKVQEVFVEGEHVYSLE